MSNLRLQIFFEAISKRECMANPKDKYYTEMYKTLFDQNYLNNAPLSNGKVREAIHKAIE